MIKLNQSLYINWELYRWTNLQPNLNLDIKLKCPELASNMVFYNQIFSIKCKIARRHKSQRNAIGAMGGFDPWSGSLSDPHTQLIHNSSYHAYHHLSYHPCMPIAYQIISYIINDVLYEYILSYHVIYNWIYLIKSCDIQLKISYHIISYHITHDMNTSYHIIYAS